MTALSFSTFFDVVLQRLPSFHPVYSQHLEDYDGLLEHVLMADLARYVIAEFRSGQIETVSTALEILESAAVSFDERLRELVVASFLENLHQAQGDFARLRHLLGPVLQEQLDASQGQGRFS